MGTSIVLRQHIDRGQNIPNDTVFMSYMGLKNCAGYYGNGCLKFASAAIAPIEMVPAWAIIVYGALGGCID